MTVATVLSVSGLGVTRGDNTLLKNVDLSIDAGEWVTAIGPNGAGKSSLVRALTGEWRSSGDVRLFGRALREWPREALARRLAVMPQSERLDFGFTVSEVVELGRLPHRNASPAVNRAAVAAVLEALDLMRVKDRLYTSLSGGERQRVQFARVMAQIWKGQEPTLLILDEPTSALDLAQQRSVLDLAFQVGTSRGAVFAVLHDLNLAARFSHRLLLLSNGTLVRDAPPVEIVTRDELARSFAVEAVVETSTTDGAPIVLLHAPGRRNSD